MKDRLGRSAFWNKPLRNPTQNAYFRFLEKPGGEWFAKGFADSEKKFKTIIQKALKTHYSDFFDE
jgi:hypothetical protein